jgi:hypothetical protein
MSMSAAVPPPARVRHVVTTLIIVALLGAALLAVGRRLHEDARLNLAADGTGSWWFPRGGPYILGFDSPGPATLTIDGQVAVKGEGKQSRRILYERGVHSVHFDAPRDARLLWHPPGRRGALEYVSPSSLSPDPPTLAEFTAPGTDHVGAAVLIGILIVLGWGLLTLSRAFDDGRIYGPGILVFLVALAVRLWGMADFGQTWDEDEYWSAGRNYALNILAGDLRPASWQWNYEHPPVTKYLAGAGALAQDGYWAARAIFAVLGAGACVLAGAIGRRLFGGRAGFVAGMIAALLPHLIAHGRIVGHETPSLFFGGLAVWAALAAAQEDRDRPLWLALRFAACGVAFGLAVGTRFINLLAAPAIAMAVLCWSRGHLVRNALLGLLVIPTAAAATVYAIWPRLWWAHPIEQLQKSYNVLNVLHDAEPYLGAMTREPPWHYFPMYLIATTPLLVLAAAFVAGPLRAGFRRERGWLVVLVWTLSCFGVAFSPVRQDGMRYILPVLLPVAVAAGAGIDALMERARGVAFLIGLTVVGYLALANLRVDPYQLDYYAEHVGGPANVQQKDWFETGWWGEGIAGAVAYVNQNAERGASVARVVSPTHVTWFRGPLWGRLTDRVEPHTEWLLVNPYGRRTTPSAAQIPPGLRPVFEVLAGGAVLAQVYQLEPSAPAPPSRGP